MGSPGGTVSPPSGPRVVVVGGGPCGATLALLLARAGWGVTLVEALALGAPRPYRGEGLMPSGVMALEAMGLWPLPAAVRHRPLDGWTVVLERRCFFTVAEPLAGDRGCWLVDQPTLLAHLRGELEALGGVRVVDGVAARGLLRAAGMGGEGRPGRTGEMGGRVVGVVLADGRELGADLVVACEGRQSSLRSQAGLALRGDGREGTGETVLWFRLVGLEVAPLERWVAGRFLTVVGAGVSFALFAEACGETLRLGWVAEAGVPLPADSAGWRECWAAALPEDAAALLRALPPRVIEGPQRFPVRVGWAPRWHGPGLLLLGDAAHPMGPVRAQGINMALRDALEAARLLGPLGRCGPVVAPAEGASPSAEEGSPWPRIDALLPTIAARRLPEIRRLQALQDQEAGLGAWLRQRGWLRRGLAATAPWSGVLARRRWIQRQHRLRRGLSEAAPLPD